MGSGRASKKKQLIVDDDDEVPSSLDAVLANDDLLIEILLRLPTNSSILLFKAVSKRWLSLITGPVSTLRYSQNPNVEPHSRLFLQRYISGPIYDYVTFDIRSQVNRSPPLLNTTANIEILQSCNGLFLCRDSNPDTTYYVYNPSFNNRSKRLPPCCNYSGFINNISNMRLAFDPIKSPHYKLVYVGPKPDDDYYIQIQTYSSETGAWSTHPNQFPRFEFLYFYDAIYWNNAFHWILGRKHSKLDVERLVLTSIRPPHHVMDTIHCSCRLFESRGCLLFLCDYTDDTRGFSIYEMSKRCSGWSMKYHINLNDINMKLFSIFGRLQTTAIKSRCYSVLCIVSGEKKEDSFLVMEICGKVVQYKIVLETIRELYDCGPIHHELPGLKRGCFPYYASFATV